MARNIYAALQPTFEAIATEAARIGYDGLHFNAADVVASVLSKPRQTP